MPEDLVPWMIGGGVKHSVEVARLVSYLASGGREGIVGTKDLEVRELATPGSSVRVFPGACAVLNRGEGMQYDAYVCRFPNLKTIPIAATGAGAGRSDLIVARVENPYQAGEPWPTPDPDDVLNGIVPFENIAVISGVPAATKTVAELALGYSAVALARVTLPVSTGTVQQSHITDLRKMATAASDTDSAIVSLTAAQAHTLIQTAFIQFPTVTAPGCILTTEVPLWATQVTVRASVAGASVAGGVVYGGTRIRVTDGVNNAYGGETPYDITVPSGTGSDRYEIATAATVAIPVAMRGKTVSIYQEGRKVSGTTNVVAAAGSVWSCNAQFKARPETNL